MHSCGGHFSNPSVHQTLHEVEFERGIWTAAVDGNVDDVEKHLRKGVSPNVTDTSGYTALHYACRHGKTTVCDLLLKHGADVNSMTRSGRVTPLHRASYCGNEGIVALLLKHGADPLLQDADGKTALHKAAEEGKYNVIKMILAHSPSCAGIVDKRSRKAVDCVSVAKQDITGLFSETEIITQSNVDET